MDLTLNDIPMVGKYKSYTAGAAMMLGGLSGLFTAVASITALTASLLHGDLGLFQWSHEVQAVVPQAMMFFAGLGIVGVRHGVTKAVSEETAIQVNVTEPTI